MISRTRYSRAMLVMLAAGFSVASAHAQTVPSGENPDMPAAETAAAPDADDADIKDLQLDWSQLNVDASTLTKGPASKARVSPQAGTAAEMSWSSKDNRNGSAVSVKQPLSPFWDTRIGADMTVTRQPTTMSELLSEKATNSGNDPHATTTEKGGGERAGKRKLGGGAASPAAGGEAPGGGPNKPPPAG